jgi:hypothetical protein
MSAAKGNKRTSAENSLTTFVPVQDRMLSIPTNNIMKQERFDEDILRQMLVDERIPRIDREVMSDYYRHARHTPSTAVVIYTLSKACTAKNIGRLYPKSNLGLACVRFDVRGPLFHKYYWDIDMENAHYNIALKLAKDNELPHTAIQYYCENRDECLSKVNEERGIAKCAYLKVAYGGDITLYREDYIDYGGTYHKEGAAHLNQIKSEMVCLANFLWDKNPHLHKMKCGKDNVAIDKRSNAKAVLMSYVLQDIEKKCLLTLDAFYASEGRTMGVLIHDGGLVEKLEGELAFPEELLTKGSTAVKEATGYSFRLVNKPINGHYDAPQSSADAYARMKADFEKNHFLIGAMLNRITTDGIRQEYKTGEAYVICAPLTIKKTDPKTLEVKEVEFLKEWLRDPNRACYERVDFIPNVARCPKSVYNLFKGFEGAKRSAEVGIIPLEERATLIAPIIKQMELLCNGDATYNLKWMANLLQNPDIKSDVSLFFRDKGGLLFEGGGVGKDSIWDFFGTKILGSDYYLNMDNNAQMYGSFNSAFEGKLLVYVQEADSRNNHNNFDILKSSITKRTTTINKKHVAQYSVVDLARWVFASNNVNPLPIKQGDRRFAMYDVNPEFRNNSAYFSKLHAAFNDKRTQAAFYQYLMEIETYRSPVDFQVNRPITSAYIDIRQMNAPAHLKWLRHALRTATLPQECGARELYKTFKTWYLNNERSPERIISETMFGKYMKEAMTTEDGATADCAAANTVRRSDGVRYRFNYEKIIEGLESLHLLNKGEAKLDADKCLINVEADDYVEPDVVQEETAEEEEEEEK